MTLTFPTIARWSAVLLDGRSRGFLEQARDGIVRYYAARSAPGWLKAYASTHWADMASAKAMLEGAALLQSWRRDAGAHGRATNPHQET